MQTFEEIISILKSLRSVRGVVIEVKSELFGTEWARSSDCPQPTYEGVIHSWKRKGEELFVKWPGYAHNKAVPLSSLEYDNEGSPLGLKLKNYEDGRPAPVLCVPPPPRQGEDGPGDLEGEAEEEQAEDQGGGVMAPAEGPDAAPEEDGSEEQNDEEDDEQQEDDKAPKKLSVNGQVWRLREPQYLKTDARTLPRSKPSLNRGDIELNSISDMCTFLTPEDWWEQQVRYTNPKLLGNSRENAKLTVGELKRWWGISLGLSLHPGVPIEKAWAVTPTPDSFLPPMNMGRHGMTINRWKRIRSVLSFGPCDEDSLRGDAWAFVRPLVDNFNKCRAEKVNPGWLLGVDELMSAWRGAQGLLDQKKCPKLSWVPRKPEPLGVENKCAGDALSGKLHLST